ncbi:MAG: hypothetical protein K2Q28_11060 [Hyphomicrobium sp.]|nr:hypothetical protein [Hyphomicrobium sp.]
MTCSALVLAGEPEAIDVKPGKGLSLDVGPKHTMTYFEPKEGGCGLTVVVAAKEGGVTGLETPGTRFVVTVAKGSALQIDTTDSHSASFECAPEGDHLHAKVFTREPHPKGKAS